MSDYNSSLPIRTETAGDVVVKVVDSVTSNQLKVNADGSIDTNANVTFPSSLEVSNDVGNPLSVSATALPLPTGAATLAEQQTQTTSLASIDNKLTSPLTVSATNLDVRDLAFATDKVDVSGSSVSISGTPTVALDSASLTALESITVQNAGGASAVNIQDGGNSITVDATDLDIRDLTHVTDSVKIGDGTEFLAVNVDGSINTKEVAVAGIADYNTVANIAAAANSSHTYTSTGNFYLTGVEASGSGKVKIEIQVNGVTKMVQFNSTSSPNMTVEFNKPLLVTSGQTVVVIRTNRDNQAQDLYSTIMGFLA